MASKKKTTNHRFRKIKYLNKVRFIFFFPKRNAPVCDLFATTQKQGAVEIKYLSMYYTSKVTLFNCKNEWHERA